MPAHPWWHLPLPSCFVSSPNRRSLRPCFSQTHKHGLHLVRQTAPTICQTSSTPQAQQLSASPTLSENTTCGKWWPTTRSYSSNTISSSGQHTCMHRVATCAAGANWAPAAAIQGGRVLSKLAQHAFQTSCRKRTSAHSPSTAQGPCSQDRTIGRSRCALKQQAATPEKNTSQHGTAAVGIMHRQQCPESTLFSLCGLEHAASRYKSKAMHRSAPHVPTQKQQLVWNDTSPRYLPSRHSSIRT